MRITAACPDALAGAANALALLVGQSEADALTYSSANFMDGDGALYRVASFSTDAAWVIRLLSAQAMPPEALPVPPWADAAEVDLVAAVEALSMIVVGPAPADPGRIQAVMHDDPQAALGILGLTAIPGGY